MKLSEFTAMQLGSEIVEEFDRAIRICVKLIAQVQNISKEELKYRSPITMEV